MSSGPVKDGIGGQPGEKSLGQIGAGHTDPALQLTVSSATRWFK